jgi:hypothetical protein
VPLYPTAGQRITIRVHPCHYPLLSAMKKSLTTFFLSQMYADEIPSQIHADDYPCACVQHCDTPAMLSTPAALRASVLSFSRTEGAGD